jgi:ubiquinone biosynthesis monooxygenase Coq7
MKARPETKARTQLPGDLPPERLIERMIRVDQAGEYGAVRIYEGQLAVLGRTAGAEAIRRMAQQERTHLEAFNALMVRRRVRPTALGPLWYVAGFALGAGTALLGFKAAMACTVAVEDVIGEHYARQIAALAPAEKALKRAFRKARRDELEHRETALAAGAREAPAYGPLTAAIKAGTRVAIWLSERI